MVSMGFANRKKLLPGAIPTIWEDPRNTVPSKKLRIAAVKREQCRVGDNFTCFIQHSVALAWRLFCLCSLRIPSPALVKASQVV